MLTCCHSPSGGDAGLSGRAGVHDLHQRGRAPRPRPPGVTLSQRRSGSRKNSVMYAESAQERPRRPAGPAVGPTHVRPCARATAGASGPAMKGHPAGSMRIVAKRYRPPSGAFLRTTVSVDRRRTGRGPRPARSATAARRPPVPVEADHRGVVPPGPLRFPSPLRRRARAPPRAGAGPRCRPAPPPRRVSTALRSCMPSVSRTIRSLGSSGKGCTSKDLPGHRPRTAVRCPARSPPPGRCAAAGETGGRR